MENSTVAYQPCLNFLYLRRNILSVRLAPIDLVRVQHRPAKHAERSVGARARRAQVGANRNIVCDAVDGRARRADAANGCDEGGGGGQKKKQDDMTTQEKRKSKERKGNEQIIER